MRDLIRHRQARAGDVGTVDHEIGEARADVSRLVPVLQEDAVGTSPGFQDDVVALRDEDARVGPPLARLHVLREDKDLIT